MGNTSKAGLFKLTAPANGGPEYPKNLGATVSKFRIMTRGRKITKDERRAYGEAVLAGIGALQRQEATKGLSLAPLPPVYPACPAARLKMIYAENNKGRDRPVSKSITCEMYEAAMARTRKDRAEKAEKAHEKFAALGAQMTAFLSSALATPAEVAHV